MRNLVILLFTMSVVTSIGCPRERRGLRPWSLAVYNATDIPIEVGSFIMRIDAENGQLVQGSTDWVKVQSKTKRGLRFGWIPKRSRAFPEGVKVVVARDGSGREFFLSSKDFYEKACVQDDGLTWVVIIDKDFQPWRPQHCAPACKACIPPQE